MSIAPLSSIFNAVNALLPAGTITGIGPDKIKYDESPPRVIWIPMNETFGPPRGFGGDFITDPSPLWTRLSSVDVHIWGKDQDATEVLLNLLIAAVHRLAHGCYEVTRGNWMNVDGASLTLGQVYILSIMFRIPVTRAPSGYAVTSTIPITGAYNALDGVIVTPT